jgi:hypothetical protein
MKGFEIFFFQYGKKMDSLPPTGRKGSLPQTSSLRMSFGDIPSLQRAPKTGLRLPRRRSLGFCLLRGTNPRRHFPLDSFGLQNNREQSCLELG